MVANKNQLLMDAVMDALRSEQRLGKQIVSLCKKQGEVVPVGFTGTARLILIERQDQTGDDIVAELMVNDSDDGDPEDEYEHLIAVPYDVQLHQLLSESPSFLLRNDPAQYSLLAEHIDNVTDQLAVMERGLS